MITIPPSDAYWNFAPFEFLLARLVVTCLLCFAWRLTFYRRHIRHPYPFNFHPSHLLSLPLLPPNRHSHPRHNNPPLHRLRLAPPRHPSPRSPIPSIYPGMYLHPPPSTTTSPATQGISSLGSGAEF